MRLTLLYQLPNLNEEDVGKISALDKNQRSKTNYMMNGTILGWTPERMGWTGYLA
jgi:hypothetical protein